MFTMFHIVSWLVFGFVIGSLAKAIYPGDEGLNFWGTIGLGVAGSFVGGLINWVLNFGGPFSPAGIVFSIVGGVLCCAAYGWAKGSGYLPK
jgi:uncharacterized membrane protein YeaQ/YmgE (transglycosylase-associated protein family)